MASKFWKPGTIAPGENEEITEDVEGDAAIIAATFASSQAAMSMEQFRRSLPVYRHRLEFLYLLERHQVVIVIGQTGSGKTTQLPQYLYEAGWTSADKMVACTQPRRVTAVSVSTRVAEELCVEVGGLVGYAVRFEERTSDETRIKYLTDGMLFREALFDPLLSRYSVIMVDEAHERSLYTDLLLGLLKKIVRRRRDLRVILSSATMNAESFKQYFMDRDTLATILSVQGRMFPVETFYLNEVSHDIVEEVTLTVFKIHMHEAIGDILVFLPGREEIDRCTALLRNRADELISRDRQRIWPMPLHATLPMEEQMKVFEPVTKSARKVVLATNIAEASVTISGIVFVVDSGLVKQRVCNPVTGMDILLTTSISQASALQRAGRAGRLKAGRAYRLYTEEQFTRFARHAVPEIQKCNLTGVVLQLKALGISNVLAFDWIDRPQPSSLAAALEFLFALGAVDGDGELTDTGRILSELPVDPMIGRMLIASRDYQCGSEAVIIAAMLAARPIFVNVSLHKRTALDEARRKLGVAEGDLLALVNIYRSYREFGTQWCQRRFLSPKALQKATQIVSLLSRYMERYGMRPTESSSDPVAVVKCIATGLFANAALAQGDGTFRSIRSGAILNIHPESCLFKRVPKCLLYYEVMETSKMYMRDVTVIERDWLAELAPDYYEFR
jgi:ATP-dependent RNA helicase DDX35